MWHLPVRVSRVTAGRFTIFLPASFCSSCKCFLHYEHYDGMSCRALYKASWEVCHFYVLCFRACRPGCNLLRQSELKEAVLQEMVLVIQLVIECLVLQKTFLLGMLQCPKGE